MVTIDIFYAVCYASIGVLMVGWLINVVKENAEARYYWLGRKDGWDMHRRMVDNDVHNN